MEVESCVLKGWKNLADLAELMLNGDSLVAQRERRCYCGLVMVVFLAAGYPKRKMTQTNC